MNFFYVFMYVIQHCFICRPSDSTVLEDDRIEPRIVATKALESHPQTYLRFLRFLYLYTIYACLSSYFTRHLAKCRSMSTVPVHCPVLWLSEFFNSYSHVQSVLGERDFLKSSTLPIHKMKNVSRIKNMIKQSYIPTSPPAYKA